MMQLAFCGGRELRLAGPALTVFLALVALGCRAGTSPDGPPPSPEPRQEQPAGRSPARWPIESEGVGPIRLGMTEEAARQAVAPYAVTVSREERMLEGMPAPALLLEHAGERWLRVELADGRVWRLEVLHRSLATPEGARVGMALRELTDRYGRGKVLTGEGNVCAVFPERAPGRSFCLDDGGELGQAADSWERILDMNPRVERILVVGSG